MRGWWVGVMGYLTEENGCCLPRQVLGVGVALRFCAGMVTVRGWEAGAAREDEREGDGGRMTWSHGVTISLGRDLIGQYG